MASGKVVGPLGMRLVQGG